MKLYKVTDAKGHSCHGGNLEWSLPAGKKPGAWHEVTGELMLCSHGLHVTTDPASWWVKDCRIFEVKAEGVEGKPDHTGKVVARRVQLVREVTAAADLASLRIFKSGAHEVKDGKAIAFDSATVRASDSATVRAYGSATVEAYDSATVEASDSATVRAYGSATVEAYDNVTCVVFYGDVKTVLKDFAAVIDRRNGKPVVHVADVTEKAA